MQYKTFTLKLTEDDYKALHEAARKRGKSATKLVRSFVAEQLREDGFIGEVAPKGGARPNSGRKPA